MEVSAAGVTYFKDEISNNIQGFIPASCIADLCDFHVGQPENLLKRLRNVHLYKQELKLFENMFEIVIDQEKFDEFQDAKKQGVWKRP